MSLGRQVGLMRGLTSGMWSHRNPYTYNGLRRISGTRRGPKYCSGTGKIGGISQKRPFRNPVKTGARGFFRIVLRFFAGWQDEVVPLKRTTAGGPNAQAITVVGCPPRHSYGSGGKPTLDGRSGEDRPEFPSKRNGGERARALVDRPIIWTGKLNFGSVAWLPYGRTQRRQACSGNSSEASEGGQQGRAY